MRTGMEVDENMRMGKGRPEEELGAMSVETEGNGTTAADTPMRRKQDPLARPGPGPAVGRL